MGELRSLDDHLPTCEFAFIPCTNECMYNTNKVYVLRRDLDSHLKKLCPNRQYECPHCKDTGRYCDITTTHLGICPKFMVACLNTGCKALVARINLSHHLTTCEYTLLHCPNKCMENNKEVKILRRDLDQHLKDKCPNRQHQCPHCKDTGRYWNITTIHLFICPKAKVFCPNDGCKASVVRCDAADHQSKCPFEKVPCKYAGIGCQKKPLRKDLQQHEDDDTFHLHLVIETVNKQRKEVDEQQEEINKQQKEIKKQQEEIDKQQKEVNKQREDIKKQEEEVNKQREDIKKQREEVNKQREGMNKQQREINRQRVEISKQQLETNRQRTEISKQQLETNKQQAEINKQQKEINKQQEEMKAVKAEQRIMSDSIIAAQAGPCVFKMPEFRQHKSSKRAWYSPPFYSHPGGYKMCIRVDANGNGAAAGTYVSVFVYLMQGRNDDNLPWPFTGEVTITLLNQLADKNHCTDKASFSQDSETSRRVVSSERASRGYELRRFLPHNRLDHDAAKNCHYLKDDCLFFQMKTKASKPVKPWLTSTF